MEGRPLIRYRYNTQKQPPAPFVLVTISNPLTGAEVRDVPAQLDTGADCTLLPQKFVDALGLNFSGSWTVGGIAGKVEEMRLYPASIGIHQFPTRTIEVVAHADEPWVLLGRDVLNDYRLLLDGPGQAIEIG
jgi:gag-polyprotein putative aspartyl protease